MNKNEFYDDLSESTIKVAKCNVMAEKYDKAKFLNAGLAGLMFLGGVASFADGDSVMGNALVGSSIIKLTEAWTDYAISADYEMKAQTEGIKKLCKITSQILSDSSVVEDYVDNKKDIDKSEIVDYDESKVFDDFINE